MKRINFFFLLLLLPGFVHAQTELKVEAADDEFYTLIPKDARIEQIGDEYQLTEGPVWDGRERCLLFSDIPANRIYKYDVTGKVTIYRDPSDNSNGLAYDKLGWLLACEHGSRSVTVMTKTHQVIPIIRHYKGKRLNSPNDLVVHSSGAIFFTDPPLGLPKTYDDPARELTFSGVFLYKNKELIVIDSTLYRPNGLALSPDQKYLYVANNQYSGGDVNIDKGVKSWFRYELNPDLTVKDKIELMRAPDMTIKGNPDGMKVDIKGNLYCAGPGGVLVFTKSGKYLGAIRLPEVPTNCTFGEADNKTLFITDRKHVYKLRVLCPGFKIK
ncbi:MAG TPA: SMP-30/gluconolactonase/LRE family protein [Bacteroidales bacterium]